MAFTMKAGGITLPAPVTVSSADELIWSADTGRTSGSEMVGTVIGEKKTIDIAWGVLSESEVKAIKAAMPAGFFTFTLRDDGGETTLTVYRGAFSGEHLGSVGDGNYYYRSLSVSVIQK